MSRISNLWELWRGIPFSVRRIELIDPISDNIVKYWVPQYRGALEVEFESG